MRLLAGACLLAALGCGSGEEPAPPVTPGVGAGVEAAQPGDEPSPVAPDEGTLAPLRGRNLHITSKLAFDTLPDAPHRLQATYQGLDRSRWSLQRLADEDADRRIEYRSGARAFLLPQDSGESIEYAGEELAQVLRRFDLRRVAMADGLDELGWDADGRLPLGSNGSSVLREDLGEEGVTFTAIDPEGRQEEILHVRTWAELGNLRRPATLELSFGALRIWSEEIETFELQSWFKERYFWPPDRADEAP
ncbi:MAG: hypothetical protein P1V81_06515 [Planctomycetota bacterium]|nr:hypothetical protein [Planctomycetota bacterium]